MTQLWPLKIEVLTNLLSYWKQLFPTDPNCITQTQFPYWCSFPWVFAFSRSLSDSTQINCSRQERVSRSHYGSEWKFGAVHVLEPVSPLVTAPCVLWLSLRDISIWNVCWAHWEKSASHCALFRISFSFFWVCQFIFHTCCWFGNGNNYMHW